MSSHDPAIILDRGYRSYHGPRTGRRGAMKAIIKEGYRRVLGLRRKAKRKLFPWTLIALALASAAILIAVEWVSSTLPVSLDTSDLFPRYGGYFDFISNVALLFAAYTGPQLLIPDRTQGVLNVYFSRPLSVRDYLVAKAVTYATVILSFWLVPQLLLHLGYAALSPGGFLSYLGETTDILWKVPAARARLLHAACLPGLSCRLIRQAGRHGRGGVHRRVVGPQPRRPLLPGSEFRPRQTVDLFTRAGTAPAIYP